MCTISRYGERSQVQSFSPSGLVLQKYVSIIMWIKEAVTMIWVVAIATCWHIQVFKWVGGSREGEGYVSSTYCNRYSSPFDECCSIKVL